MSTVIGIPTLNGPGRLQRCLRSIAECASLDDLRVVVCDDGSTEEHLNKTKEVIQHESAALPFLELLTNDGRRGISYSWNRLARRYADAKTVILLNDDTELVLHAREALEFSLRENPTIGMVGLNAYLSLTKQQHANVFDAGREQAGYAKTQPHERMPRIDYNEARLLDAGGQGLLSSQGAAFAFRKEVFDKVGGFDERYFVYYEELDFGCSLWKAGYVNFILSYPIIFHQGGATNSDPANLDARQHMERSKKLFEEKWGKGISALRAELNASYRRPAGLKEWNTQYHNWR